MQFADTVRRPTTMSFVDQVRHFQAESKRRFPTPGPVRPPWGPKLVTVSKPVFVQADEHFVNQQVAMPAVAQAPTPHAAVIATAVLQSGPVEGAVRFAVILTMRKPAPTAVQPSVSSKVVSVPAKEPEWKQRRPIVFSTATIRRQARADRRHNKFDDRWFEIEPDKAIGRVASRVYYLMFGNKLETYEHDKYNCSNSSSRRNHGRKPRDRHPRWLSNTLGTCVLVASRIPVVGGSGYHTPRRLLKLVESWETTAATATVN